MGAPVSTQETLNEEAVMKRETDGWTEKEPQNGRGQQRRRCSGVKCHSTLQRPSGCASDQAVLCYHCPLRWSLFFHGLLGVSPVY